MTVRMAALAVAVALATATPAAAQVSSSEGWPGAPGVFSGSVASGSATTEPLRLSVKDAIARALQYNLGLLLQEQAVQQAHGARWRALSDLLPDVSGNLVESRQVINLDAYGFPGEPKIIGPFNVFDARVALSQPIVDMRALNDVRAASANERAEKLGVRSARDLVSLVAGNLYLMAVAATSRIEAAHAQQETAEALFRQATDLKSAGLIAGIDVLRAQVQIQNQRQRSIRAENELEKTKLQLARAIGLPAGQPIILTSTIGYAPLAEVTIDAAIKIALESRSDYLAARERLAAAELSRRAAADERLPTFRVDADYGTIGPNPGGSHPTYRVGATVHVPLFDAGQATARRIEADAELKRRQLEVDDFKGQIEFDVRTALLDLNSAAQQLEAADANRTLAAQELVQARDRFAAGVAGNIEVTQAQESVASASESYIAALYAHNLAKAWLARAVGTVEQSIAGYLGSSE